MGRTASRVTAMTPAGASAARSTSPGFGALPYPVNPGALLVFLDPGHGADAPGGVEVRLPDGRLDPRGDAQPRHRAPSSRPCCALPGCASRRPGTTDVPANVARVDRNSDRRVDGADDYLARIDGANRARADLFISIHNNSIPGGRGRTEAFYCGAGCTYPSPSRALAAAILDAHVAALTPLETASWQLTVGDPSIPAAIRNPTDDAVRFRVGVVRARPPLLSPRPVPRHVPAAGAPDAGGAHRIARTELTRLSSRCSTTRRSGRCSPTRTSMGSSVGSRTGRSGCDSTRSRAARRRRRGWASQRRSRCASRTTARPRSRRGARSSSGPSPGRVPTTARRAPEPRSGARTCPRVGARPEHHRHGLSTPDDRRRGALEGGRGRRWRPHVRAARALPAAGGHRPPLTPGSGFDRLVGHRRARPALVDIGDHLAAVLGDVRRTSGTTSSRNRPARTVRVTSGVSLPSGATPASPGPSSYRVRRSSRARDRGIVLREGHCQHSHCSLDWGVCLGVRSSLPVRHSRMRSRFAERALHDRCTDKRESRGTFAARVANALTGREEIRIDQACASRSRT